MLKFCAISALILAGASTPALADDAEKEIDPGSAKREARAEKIIATLDKLGLNDSTVNRLVSQASERTKGGYFYLTEEEVDTGKVSLRYATGGGLNMRQMELAYVSDDKHYQVTASTQGVMVRYRHSFK